MSKQIFYDDVAVGAEIPPFSVKAGYLELNRFAGANEELIPIHMDPDYSKNVAKLPDVIVMGNLKLAYMANAITDWAGDDAWIKKLACQYRKMDVVNTTLTAKGAVTKKYEQDGQGLIECDIWVENDKGEKGTLGTAVVSLPKKK